MKRPWEPKIEDHFDGQMNLGDNVSHHTFPWGMWAWIALGVLCVVTLAGLWIYGYYHLAQ